jgi:GNAT superfamily N-acetyltransferase
MKRRRIKITYLEMLSPSWAAIGKPIAKATIERLDCPDVECYRADYSRVGKEYQWIERMTLSDDALRQLLQDDRVDVYRFYVSGQPAGFGELDRRTRGEVQLAYFGLFPAFIGQGWGKCFLGRMISEAWSYGPQRVWLHTCNLDHVAALPNYLRAGFRVYDERIVEQEVPQE